MKALEKELDRLSQTLEQGFIARNFLLKVVMCFVLYPIAALLSGMTEGMHLYINMEQTFASAGISITLTLLFVILIEAGQYFALNGVVDDLREGVVAESRHHVVSFVIKLALAIILLIASISLSIQGAPIANEYFKKKSSPIALVNTDSINARYDAQIATENAAIDKASKITWHGKIVEGGQKIITKAQGQKAIIEENRRAELAQAEAENQYRQADYNGKLEHSGLWFTRFAGIGELLKLICLIFLGNYEAGGQKEAKEGAPTLSNGQSRQQPVATDPKIKIKLDRCEMALKNAKSNLSAWQSKLDKGEGTFATNQRNITKWELEIAAIEAELITLKG